MLDLHELTDDDLLLRAKAGDARSFGVLYGRHESDGVRYARRLIGSAADDVFAEAVTKVLEAIGRGYGPHHSFRPYLFTAIRSVAQDLGTQRARTVPMADPASIDLRDGAGLEEIDLADEAGLQPLLVEALADLSPAQREVLWYVEAEQRQPIEVAQKLGISPNAVSARAYRARHALRRRFLARYLLSGRTDAVCDEIRHQLDPYLRGELSLAERRVVEEHLDACDDCAVALGARSRTADLVVLPLAIGLMAMASLRWPAPPAVGAPWRPRSVREVG